MLKNLKSKKAIANLARIFGIGLMLYGMFTAKTQYELLYSFAGGGEASFSKAGVELMPESILGYLLLIIVGIVVAFVGSSIGEAKNDPNHTSVIDAKDAQHN